MVPKKEQKSFFFYDYDYRLMQAKGISKCSFKLSLSINLFVLSIFKWPLKTGFTVDYLNVLNFTRIFPMSTRTELNPIYWSHKRTPKTRFDSQLGHIEIILLYDNGPN